VITTVNIQHLESIADAVEQMTGAQVRERVPDWVVRKADQIELVDSSPEQLRRRMLHGNIYPKDKVPQALTHFFRTDNLIALRELALRFLADETEEELLEHLAPPDRDVWETTERIMVAVTAAPGTDAPAAAGRADRGPHQGELDVVHVVIRDGPRDEGREGHRIALRSLAVDVGARLARDPGRRPAQAIVGFARDHQITQIVIGSSQRSRGPVGGRTVKVRVAGGGPSLP
jgi:two-component system sensor histidine kinase KdpD